MPAVQRPKYIPSVRAHQLANILIEARETAGLPSGEAAARLGWSPGKLSHIEGMRNRAKPADVALMLEVYGVPSPDRDAIIALSREAGKHGWWTAYIDVFSGPYVALEDAAAEVWDWAPQNIPGLLQTKDYARALMREDGLAPGEIDVRLRARQARQTILTREGTPGPPVLHVVLDESVLERPVGSRAIMRHQLNTLVTEADRPNITIQVLPRSVGAHVGMNGPLILLRFTEDIHPDVGYVEGFHGAVYLEAPQQIAKCNVAFERLCRAALDPEESAALIGAAANSKVPSNAPPSA